MKKSISSFVLLISFSLVTFSLQGQNTCASPTGIVALPFSATGQTTSGTGDDYDNTDACSSTSLNGDDYVYSYTPAQNECVSIQLRNTVTCAGLFVLDDCPDVGGATCIGSATGQGPIVNNLSLTSGTTYYFVVSSNPSCAQSTPFDIYIRSTASTGGTGTDCANAYNLNGNLPFSEDGFTNCCSVNDYGSTTLCSSTSYLDGEEYVFSYTASAGECIAVGTANTSPSNLDVGIFISDLCPSDPAATCLASQTQPNGAPSLGYTFSSPGTYYIIVSSPTTPSCGFFDLYIEVNSTGSTGSDCANADNIASLPYSESGLTTCCAGDDYDSFDACGSVFMEGNDYVYSYTSPGNECIEIVISNTLPIADMGVFVMNGCPENFSTSCIAQAFEFNGAPSLSTNLNAAGTYYFVVASTSNPQCTSFGIDITSTPIGAPGTNCANADDMLSIPFSRTGETTACLSNSYDNTSTASCGSSYESGQDHVYLYTKTNSSPECLNITLSNTSTNSIGFTVYEGCPDVGGTSCINSSGPAVGNTLTSTVILPSAGTYYIIVDGSEFSVDYDIDITSNGPSQVNDLPCNASALTLGSLVYGNNECTNDASEPVVPVCWSGGTRHTVWYSVVCPASGEISVRTAAGTLLNTQIALYSGTCGSLTLVGCNDDYSLCGSGTLTSEIVASGLTPGNTYFIAVDGDASTVGVFSIVAIDGTSSYPVVNGGQDCSLSQAIQVCSQIMTVGDPGLSGAGDICDFDGSGTCITIGERNSAWYTIDIATNGTLNFSIIPNDATTSSCGAETDYEFSLWKTVGIGATDCAAIAASGGAGSVACNYFSDGVTGLSASGNAPAPYSSCFNDEFDPGISVVSGEQYILCVLASSVSTTSGFTLDFSNTAAGVINFSTPSSVSWGGANDTDWNDAGNWGNCVSPTCTIDAVITNGPTNQPILTGTHSVENLTINPGSNLTLGPGCILNICGDLTCLGTLTCDPTSTLVFNNASSTQTINGYLSGNNKLGNLTIDKTGGQVQLNTILEVGGNFTTNNATSVFNAQGETMILGGDFINSSGGTTFTGMGTTGTLEFNGTALQQYTPGGSLSLNDVLMNNSSGGVNLNGNMILSSSGELNLLQGVIITGANRVEINNTASGGVNAGSATSYIQGNLRRYLNSTGTYDFPVGEATKGYQRAYLDFTGATSISYLDCRFDPYPGVPPVLGATDCSVAYNGNALDNGYWTFTPDANGGTGTYNTILYPMNYTQPGNSWTVMRNNGSWALINGTCATSTANVVRRNDMSGFSLFGVAQSGVLPVDLLYFEGEHRIDHNFLQWETATEQSSDYFAIERSADNVQFNEIGQVAAAGNSTERKYYSFRDRDLGKPLYYYRLRQMDLNGDFKYWNPIAIRADNTREGLSELYPNPTQTAVYLDITTPTDTQLNFELMEVNGRLIRKWEESISKGFVTVETPVDDLSKGIYLLKVSAGSSSLNRVYKLMIQN